MAKQRISFGSQYKFPLKLFEVANDGQLIKWTKEGTSVTVDQKEFEESVMLYYPGFVQVKTFHNLRRLFRDYTFNFQVLRRRKPNGLKLEFRHPFFSRDNPHLVLQVRKSTRRYSMHPLATSSPKSKLSRTTRWRRTSVPKLEMCKFVGFDSKVTISCDSDELDSCSQLVVEHSTSENSWTGQNIWSNNTPFSVEQQCQGSRSEQHPVDCLPAKSLPHKVSHHYHPHKSDIRRSSLTEEDVFILAQTFAKNELSESEFWEVVARRCGNDEWQDKSWDSTVNLLNSIVSPELSPLHHQGFYYELSIDEL